MLDLIYFLSEARGEAKSFPFLSQLAALEMQLSEVV